MEKDRYVTIKNKHFNGIMSTGVHMWDHEGNEVEDTRTDEEHKQALYLKIIEQTRDDIFSKNLTSLLENHFGKQIFRQVNLSIVMESGAKWSCTGDELTDEQIAYRKEHNIGNL